MSRTPPPHAHTFFVEVFAISDHPTTVAVNSETSPSCHFEMSVLMPARPSFSFFRTRYSKKELMVNDSGAVGGQSCRSSATCTSATEGGTGEIC